MIDASPIPPTLSLDPSEVQSDPRGLERRFALLERQIQRLQKLAAMGTMSAALAHEFKNLLTPIVGYAQAGRARGTVEAMSASLERIERIARRGGEVCGKIVAMSGDDGGAPAPTALRPLVDDALDCLGRDLARDGIAIAIEVAPDLRARAHAASIQHVLFNLLINARQAMLKDKGHLTITAQRVGDHMVRLSVRDTGPGIRPEHLPRLFEPFFSTKTRGDEPARRGLGLGLTVSKQLVEQSGGRLTVESTPGAGATFTLWLPAAE